MTALVPLHPLSGPALRRDLPAPRHDARSLTGGGREARIELDGQTYTLRITRQGKLILTK
ncbi:MAG: hemin uptake protein HemP [Rhodobacteraceae bacterium]|nr:hemin uptake protein HemP [Paracoccaceae bacterium]